MPPRGPLVRRGPETHAATKGRATSSTDVAAQVASPVGSYGRPGSPGAAASALGSSYTTPFELVGHSTYAHLQGVCCLALQAFNVSQSAGPAASTWW